MLYDLLNLHLWGKLLIRKLRFIKAGKNPILNQQIEELKQLEAQIRDEETKLDEYQRLIDEKDKSERHLSHLKENLKQLSKCMKISKSS